MKILGKTCWLLLLISLTPAWGQNLWTVPGVVQACGPAKMKFNVEAYNSSPTLHPPCSEEARVFIVQNVPKDVAGWTVTRIGIDGRWVGANLNRSHFSVLLKPGVHHFCVSGQWSRFFGPNSIALLRMMLQGGDTYYVQVRFWESSVRENTLVIGPVNPDEGEFLVDTSKYSISHRK